MGTLKRTLITTAWLAVMFQILAGQEAEPAPDPEEVRTSLVEVERLRNASEYDKGLDLALDALDKANRLKDPVLTTEAHYQTAVIYNYLGNFEQARAHLEIGLTHARMENLRNLEADLMVARGIIEWKLGNLNLATRHLEEALAIRKESGNRVSMANIANNLGIIQFSLKDYPAAVEAYRQGLEWLGDEESDRLRASLYSNMAESLMPSGAFGEAEEFLLKALDLERKENEPHAIAYTYLNLGELRSAQGRSEEAVELFHKALELQESIDAVWAAATTRIRLARQQLKGGHPDRALEEMHPGFESAKRLNALSLLRDYAELYEEIYSLQGEEGMARYYQELHDWMVNRVTEPLPEEPVIRSSFPQVESRPGEVRTRELTSAWMRVATLALLGILIAFLVVENMRLRKVQPPEE